MTTPSQKLPRTPTLGEWALTAKLGRRREYLLYRAQHVSTGERAYLRVLGSEASAIDRDRFLAENAIVSKHPEHFLPVHSLRSHGAGLVAVSAVPQQNLHGYCWAGKTESIAKFCLQLSQALQILHEAGRIHGVLCPEAVELVRDDDPRVRLLDMGMGLELGHSYSASSQPHLPPEVAGFATASAVWDIYGLGLLGMQMLEEATKGASEDGASAPLRALFSACIAEAPDKRPYTMSIVQRRLRDIISHFPSNKSKARRRPPRAARLTPTEAQWFVGDSLTGAEASAIEGFEPEKLSLPARVLASLLSVTAGTALALIVAALIGFEAFGY